MTNIYQEKNYTRDQLRKSPHLKPVDKVLVPFSFDLVSKTEPNYCKASENQPYYFTKICW